MLTVQLAETTIAVVNGLQAAEQTGRSQIGQRPLTASPAASMTASISADLDASALHCTAVSAQAASTRQGTVSNGVHGVLCMHAIQL